MIVESTNRARWKLVERPNRCSVWKHQRNRQRIAMRQASLVLRSAHCGILLVCSEFSLSIACCHLESRKRAVCWYLIAANTKIEDCIEVVIKMIAHRHLLVRVLPHNLCPLHHFLSTFGDGFRVSTTGIAGWYPLETKCGDQRSRSCEGRLWHRANSSRLRRCHRPPHYD